MKKEHIENLKQMIEAFEKMTNDIENIIEEEVEQENLIWKKFILTEEWLFFTSWTTEWNVYIVEAYDNIMNKTVKFKNDKWDIQIVFIDEHIILLNNI